MQTQHSKTATSFQNETTFPASMIQRQFWLINQMQKKGSAYNIASVFQLKGSLDKTALLESVNKIVQRHEILRTNFTINDGEIVQIIRTKLALPLNYEEATQETEQKKLLDNAVTTPFNLQEDPLIRLQLIKTDVDKYIFSIVLHHIVTDLKSKQLFGEELTALYNAKITGTPSALLEPCQQYSDYAQRHLLWLESSSAKNMVEFWKQELSEQSGVLNLPLNTPRPANPNGNGSHRVFSLSESQTKTLKEFSQQRTVSLFVTLLTAYLVVMARYTNQKQLVIGVPLSNRRHADDKETMGAFVNILPLAFDLAETYDFNGALKLVRLKMLTAHRHQEVPFEEILQALKPKRDPSYNPIFQVGFTAEPSMELKLEQLSVDPLRVHNQGAQLDIFLNIKSFGPELHGYFEFNTDIFKATTIGRLRDHYLNLLHSVTDHSGKPLNLLPLISEKERNQLLHDFNQTETSYPDLCLHELIEKQVSKTPDAIAASFEGTSLTYQNLNSRANQVANMLRENGIKAESLVGVYLERSLEMLIAICAIHKAGGAYVPLDTEFPVHRIGQMLEDAEPGVILTQKAVVKDLPENLAKTICMDGDQETIASYSEDNLQTISSPENLAYVIFTSGSTGRPKGVQVPQRAMVNFLWSMKQEPGISDTDTLLAVTTLSFDISVLELFLPLIAGAKIEIASSATAKDGQALLDLMRSSQATILQATPTTFHLLIGAGWDAPAPITVLCGGELFPHELAQKLTQLAKSVWNMYGPTETTVWSSVYQITEGSPVLVGHPIANTQVYIVNDQNQPTPIGVAGELLIGGDGVTRGYLHRDELNRQQFIEDIFKTDSRFKVYRTGDLACFLESGEIKILGRIDHQIKIRGFRIELGEIETAIVSHPAVKQGVAKTHDFGGGDVRLIAYVTLQNKEKSAPLRSYLKDILPHYMIPSIFTIIEEMPLTLNNKIDRKALPKPDMSRSAQAEKIVLPQNRTEAELALKWAQVLHLKQVGVDETFFDLGGNSLLSLQLISLLEQDLHVKIPIVKFYQYPTIRLLSEYLQKNEGKENNGARDSAKPTAKNSLANRAKLQQQALAKLRQRAQKNS